MVDFLRSEEAGRPPDLIIARECAMAVPGRHWISHGSKSPIILTLRCNEPG